MRSKFLEAFELLNDPDRGKEAESHLTFCLYRLEPHETIRDQGVNLLDKLPWRSEAICSFLGRFKNNSFVIEELNKFISEHKVYSWHRANALWALYQVSKAKDVASICRAWLADTQLDWYARTMAARILAEVPSQHSYLIECLKREQEEISIDAEATAILRQELAYSAFQRIKSDKKQLALLQLICSDTSPILHRLAIYLLQQPECKVNWDHLKPYHDNMNQLSILIHDLGLSKDARKPCFIAQTMKKTYQVSLSQNDLRILYKNDYEGAVEKLRESVIEFQKSPSLYTRSFHQFTHITFIAFYKYALPEEKGIYGAYYHDLIHRKTFKKFFPNSVDVWEELNNMRNRVDHPINKKNESHSKKITVKEVEFLNKKLQVALQEMFDIWLNVSTDISVAEVKVNPNKIEEATTETIEVAGTTVA